MKILGITGGSGSGKTTLLRVVEQLGGLGLDCDAIYHCLLETDDALVAAIGARFPGTVRDGRVDRPALAAVVFADPAELAALDALTHEAVAREVRRRLWQSEAPFAAIDAIGLFESGLASLCDETVCVLAPEETRIERLIRRDGISRERALARIRAQKSDEALRAQCGHALWADAPTPEAFQQQCEQFLKGVLMMEETKKFAKEREALLSSPKNGYDRISEADLAAMESYCKEYMKFISDCKMEREAVKWTIEAAEKAGFRELKPGMQLKPGDRVYGNNHNKSVIFAVVGSESLNEGTHICAAHIDSPRLDLKPNPLYEDAGMAYFKTHYYGGIKKYQWTTTPLAIHGVVAKKDGTVVTVTVGEEPGDPIFCVTDLLVHLSADQMRKTLAEGVTGENLRILLGSRPLKDDEGADRVKFAILMLLNEKYGLTEEDFLSAELTMVPAGPAREVGFDRSLIAAYGHDDRVCAYAAFKPLLDLGTPVKTAVCVLADKEEIGSVGISGMQSQYFEMFMEDLCEATGASKRRCFEHSFCLSADVSNAFDPLYAETCDPTNNTKINYGTGIFKYTGARGKSGSSDAAAEVMGYVRRIFAKHDVIWQTGELGKVDQGGGGTVACYMANRNIETVDAGVPVLSMHAPMEIVSKLDEKKEEYDAFMRRTQTQIDERLSELHIEHIVYGRIKHPYSIYRKMFAQNKTLDEIFDLYAFRVIVDDIPECYNVLGCIHDMFKPVLGRFKDYIGTPKPNGYQSLHTTVMGNDGIPFEVQIRTKEMHEIAEYGVAAHWKYKQNGQGAGTEGKYEWVRRLLENQEGADAEEFIHSLKVDMFADEVFVFTPNGDVQNLPAGATPIDFAYAIHSAVGNRMIGAKVNNRIVTLDHVLKNGDIVEILTSKNAKGPSRDWVKIAKSTEARSKIR